MTIYIFSILLVILDNELHISTFPIAYSWNTASYSYIVLFGMITLQDSV